MPSGPKSQILLRRFGIKCNGRLFRLEPIVMVTFYQEQWAQDMFKWLILITYSIFDFCLLSGIWNDLYPGLDTGRADRKHRQQVKPLPV